MKRKKIRVRILIITIIIVGGLIGVYFLHPHQYKETLIKEATCTQNGEVLYKCWCGKSYREEIKALGHDYTSSITKEATCTEDGETTFTCSRCGDTYQKPIKALGHDYKEEIIAPTCTEDGKKVRICSRCKDKKEEIIPAIGHDYEVTEDTETKTVYTCKNCGDSYTKEKKVKKSESVGTGEVLGNGWFNLEGMGDGSVPQTGGVPDNIIFY